MHHEDGAPVRILIDPSGYRYANLADTAMLEVALERLRSFWPRAAVDILSLDPAGLAQIDSRAHCLDAFGSLGWSADAMLFAKSMRGSLGSTVVLDKCRDLRRRNEWFMKFVGRAALSTDRRSPDLVSVFLDTVRSADLVLMTGGGPINDTFRRDALGRLETLELAQEAGAVTAIVGQSIGPISDPILRSRAAQVLPHVDFISLRDGLGSLAQLKSLGVSSSVIRVTGDDAVTLAYDARKESPGTALGINLRVAWYSGVESGLVDDIGRVVREAAPRLGASLLPLPIAHSPEHDDVRAIQRVTGADVSAAPSTSGECLSLLPQCRIVVTGSYHAAVFALSMGIPAITISSCDHYAQKFSGLADQFGPACVNVLTSAADFQTNLRTAIDAAWKSAEESRPQLLAAAARQIAAGEAAYLELFDLVESRRRVVDRSAGMRREVTSPQRTS